ncbi:MAG: dephospho-CoA kinase [Mycobacterium sp.]|jgi:dephospho-CoA kinase|nr:dephospho-CoA kinase [Mycobacterium sp.]
MLRIGLTGGIGAGKSTVSATFSECGGIILDGDVIAREVVEPGTEGLAQLVEAFGKDILLPDGALNRPALAAKAFVDDEHRATLNGIVHPLVARRRQEILDAVHEDAVVVEDIPLLVETGMAPMFPLVVVVTADIETRVTRLIKRGMDEADARARIKAQAPEEQRRAIADVLLDNSGSQGELVEKARDLWYNRVLPLAHNIRTRQCAPTVYKLVAYDPAWPADARRIIRRIQTACGSKALRVDHIGSTAVEGMDAKDVVDIQITVESLDVTDDINEALANVGYPRVGHITTDTPHTDDPALWRKRIHCAADPGRPANIHVRVDGWPGQLFALLFRDWLAANPGVQEDYLAAKRRALSAPDYVEAKEPWFLDAYGRALAWAEATGWGP